MSRHPYFPGEAGHQYTPGRHERMHEGLQGNHNDEQQSQLRKFRGSGGEMLSGNELPYETSWDRALKVANSPALAGQESSGPLSVYWPQSGIVVAMAGTALGDGSAQGYASIGVRIEISDGRESIFVEAGTQGATRPAFHSFASLFGADGHRKALLRRPVYQTLTWSVEFFNFGSGEGTVLPELIFFVDSDPGEVRRINFKRIKVPEGTELEIVSPAGARVVNTAHVAGHRILR